MASSSTINTKSSAQESRSSHIENFIGFVTFSAISVGAVFLLAGAFTSIAEHLMRYGVMELSRAFGGMV